MTYSPTNQLGPYSPVRKAGNYYFISGQVGVNKEKHSTEDVITQTKQALQNLNDVLESADIEARDIVKTTVFLKNVQDFTAFNEVYMEYFTEPRPARSCVAVSSLPQIADNELLVEIEAVAYREPNG